MKTSIVKWFKDLPQEEKAALKVKYPYLIDQHLLHFCPYCKAYEKEAKFLYESGYYTRTITYNCKCGHKFNSIK